MEIRGVVPTHADVTVLVQSDIELLRLGIERASRRLGLRITNDESHATLIVRDGHRVLANAQSIPILEVEDGVVNLTACSVLAAELWAAIGRLANEVLRPSGHLSSERTAAEIGERQETRRGG